MVWAVLVVDWVSSYNGCRLQRTSSTVWWCDAQPLYSWVRIVQALIWRVFIISKRNSEVFLACCTNRYAPSNRVRKTSWGQSARYKMGNWDTWNRVYLYGADTRANIGRSLHTSPLVYNIATGLSIMSVCSLGQSSIINNSGNSFHWGIPVRVQSFAQFAFNMWVFFCNLPQYTI